MKVNNLKKVLSIVAVGTSICVSAAAQDFISDDGKLCTASTARFLASHKYDLQDKLQHLWLKNGTNAIEAVRMVDYLVANKRGFAHSLQYIKVLDGAQDVVESLMGIDFKSLGLISFKGIAVGDNGGSSYTYRAGRSFYQIIVGRDFIVNGDIIQGNGNNR